MAFVSKMCFFCMSLPVCNLPLFQESMVFGRQVVVVIGGLHCL